MRRTICVAPGLQRLYTCTASARATSRESKDEQGELGRKLNDSRLLISTAGGAVVEVTYCMVGGEQ